MKQNRDAAALAASLKAAAATPLPLPVQDPPQDLSSEPATVSSSPMPKEERAEKVHMPTPKRKVKVKLNPDTVGITLRPERELHHRYVMAAAERTRKEGRVISAQQIMLEVLETGPKVQQ
jgi:hypothetical protein